MSGPAPAGLFLDAKDLARPASYYESVLGMARLRATDELIVLQSQNVQLVVHATRRRSRRRSLASLC